MNNVLLVVNQPRDCTVDIPGATVVSAREYLTDAAYGESQPARVINLCRTDRYQGRGYYVSLLAEAQGHHPLPEVKTLGDLQSENAALFEGLPAEHIERAMAAVEGDSATVDAYFGRDPLRRNDALCQRLFAMVRVPLLRATFERNGSRWRVRNVAPLSITDIPREHQAFFATAATEFLARKTPLRVKDAAPETPRLGILFNEDEPEPPSNRAALDKFLATAEGLGMRAEILRRDDIEKVAALDALLIRDTTAVNHYTYQFARRAAAEGIVVVDDPDSILRCTNKVYLNALLSRHRVPVPKTLMVHRDNVGEIVPALGLPCILKQPDGAFSRGVAKIETADALFECLDRLFVQSDLVIAQEWLPTDFDWRVGVYDRRPLFVCKYFMAPGHWQIVKREKGRKFEGSTVAMTVGEAPEIVVKTALRAANLIGDGLYGVDLKQANNQCYVMEINDNPNIDAGNEDSVLHDALYREVVGVLLRRVQERSGVAAG
jgi:glutathione synthase/RimK-type ligase-like ATP-grasp enzyme